jgi:NTP pyrophosphatase (non-canonical NTP hydrolase)
MSWSDETTPLAEVKARLEAFNQARDWGRFHTPKDLAMCLAAEAGELLEPFLWKREGEAFDRAEAARELADVVICAVNLASRLQLDLTAAIEAKIALNDERYPVDLARGRADKHHLLKHPADVPT